MEPTFNIAICGGGNLAHGCIASIGYCNQHFKISVLSRRPEVWDKQIVAKTNGTPWAYRGDMVGKIAVVSNKGKDVVSDADIILVCSPAHTKHEILMEIKDHVKPGTLIGSVFGQGAFDWQAQHVFGDKIEKKNLTIFSLQYVPAICKILEYGKSIQIIGPKKMLYAACYPLDRLYYVCNALSQCFFLACVPISSFLNITLCPSNQIIHPGRVIGYFDKFPQKCEAVIKFGDVPLLYEDLDQISADEIDHLSDEIQLIKNAILRNYPQINLDQVLPIKERICTMYSNQISDKSSLKTVFNTNTGYRVVPFPMLPVPGQDLKNIPKSEVKVKLNLKHRFFEEDMPFGLVILKDIGDIVGVNTPYITRAIIFHQKYMDKKYIDEATGDLIPSSLRGTGAPSAYGINTISSLVKTSLGNSDVAHNIYFNKRAKL